MCKWIGDTFGDMQVIPVLKKRYPQAEIHVVAKPFSRFLFRGVLPETHIHISDQVISDCNRENFSFRQWKRDLKHVQNLAADILYDFTETPFSAVFSALSGAKFTVGYDHLGRFSALYNRRCHAEYGLHLMHRPFRLIDAEGCSPRLIPQIPEPVTPGFDLIIFPGAGWKTKEYPAEKYHKIAKLLSEKGFFICVAGSQKEKDLCELIVFGIERAKLQIGSLEDMLNHLASSRICLSGDTGPAHISAAMGIQTITLFCGTNPDFCGPLGEKTMILRSVCPMMPKDGVQFCPVNRQCSCSHPCFMAIEPEMIVEQILKINAEV